MVLSIATIAAFIACCVGDNVDGGGTTTTAALWVNSLSCAVGLADITDTGLGLADITDTGLNLADITDTGLNIRPLFAPTGCAAAVAAAVCFLYSNSKATTIIIIVVAPINITDLLVILCAV